MPYLTPENLAIFGGVWAAAIGLAQAIVRLTPSDKDDKILAQVGAFAESVRNVLQLQRPSAPSDDQNT